jgi:hypothetical protein
MSLILWRRRRLSLGRVFELANAPSAEDCLADARRPQHDPYTAVWRWMILKRSTTHRVLMFRVISVRKTWRGLQIKGLTWGCISVTLQYRRRRIGSQGPARFVPTRIRTEVEPISVRLDPYGSDIMGSVAWALDSESYGVRLLLEDWSQHTLHRLTMGEPVWLSLRLVTRTGEYLPTEWYRIAVQPLEVVEANRGTLVKGRTREGVDIELWYPLHSPLSRVVCSAIPPPLG